MCFGGGPSASEQAARAEQARKEEATRLAAQQKIKDAETLKNTLASKAAQASTEAAASAERKQFFAKSTLGGQSTGMGGTSEDLTKKKTLLANYGS